MILFLEFDAHGPDQPDLAPPFRKELSFGWTKSDSGGRGGLGLHTTTDQKVQKSIPFGRWGPTHRAHLEQRRRNDVPVAGDTAGSSRDE
jgi:hypothetical protein